LPFQFEKDSTKIMDWILNGLVYGQIFIDHFGLIIIIENIKSNMQFIEIIESN
jgi:hypothetical protein